MMSAYPCTCIQMVWRLHLTANNDHYRRFLLRKLAFLATVFTFLILPNLILPSFASAQQADVIFHKRFGIGFDATWRGGQGNFDGLGEPYRPILFDFNGVYQPRLGKKTGLDLMGGVGWQTTRFYGYQPTSSCVYFGACYNSSNHFLVDVGAGLRYYVWGHVFVRPEVRYFHVLNNSDVYTSGDILRVGASIGYTIGGGPD